MTILEFNETVAEPSPRANWPIQLKALWYLAKGEWKIGHDLIDHLEDEKSAQVHAHFHRLEGDQWNANYWYSRANVPFCNESFPDEWSNLVEIFLKKLN